jgi:hypothetical protein
MDRDALEPEQNLGSDMDVSSSDLSETDPGYLFQNNWIQLNKLGAMSHPETLDGDGCRNAPDSP